MPPDFNDAAETNQFYYINGIVRALAFDAYPLHHVICSTAGVAAWSQKAGVRITALTRSVT